MNRTVVMWNLIDSFQIIFRPRSNRDLFYAPMP